MYIRSYEGLGQTLGQRGLGQCDTTSAGSLTFVNILATIGCELQRKFASPNDPKLLTRRRRLRELFNGVPSPKAKDLFDQLQQKTDPLAQLFRSRIATPTRKELLSILFFAEYDLRLGPDIPTNPRMTAAEKATRMADIFDVMVPALLLRRNARAADALLG